MKAHRDRTDKLAVENTTHFAATTTVIALVYFQQDECRKDCN